MAPTCKIVKLAIRICKEKPESASVERKGEYAQEKNSVYRVWYHLLFLAPTRGVGVYSPRIRGNEGLCWETLHGGFLEGRQQIGSHAPTNDPSLPESQTSSTTWKLCTSSVCYPLQVMSSTGVQPLLLERGPPFFSTVQQGPPNAHNTPSFFLLVSLLCSSSLACVCSPVFKTIQKAPLYLCRR